MKTKKTIVVTGATGKIGTILIQRLLNLGYEVIGIGRSEEKFSIIKKKIGANASFKEVKLDLLQNNIGEILLSKLTELNIFPSILINNARSLENLRLSDNGIVSSNDFLNEFNLGVVSPYNLIMEMTKQKNSKLESVINISSIYGLVAPNLNLYKNPKIESFPHYGVTKAALIHLTKELAVRLIKKNIKVNCIAFGGFEGSASEELRAKYKNFCPMGEMLNEEDIFNPIKFLVENNSLAINGHTLVVDGGWTIW